MTNTKRQKKQSKRVIARFDGQTITQSDNSTEGIATYYSSIPLVDCQTKFIGGKFYAQNKEKVAETGVQY